MTYLQNRNPKTETQNALFITEKGKRVTTSQVRNNGESEYSKSLNVKEKIATRAATHIRNSNAKSQS